MFFVVSFIISRLRESRTYWQPWVMKIPTRQAHEEDGQPQLILTSCSTDNSFQECVVKRSWKSGGNGRCRTWRKGVSVTPNAADFRMNTANVDFARRTSPHASTLSQLVWDRQFARVRFGGCKRHTYVCMSFTPAKPNPCELTVPYQLTKGARVG